MTQVGRWPNSCKTSQGDFATCSFCPVTCSQDSHPFMLSFISLLRELMIQSITTLRPASSTQRLQCHQKQVLACVFASLHRQKYNVYVYVYNYGKCCSLLRFLWSIAFRTTSSSPCCLEQAQFGPETSSCLQHAFSSPK